MKKRLFIAFCLCTGFGMAVHAQAPAAKHAVAQQEITFDTAKEKQEKVKILEEKISINAADPTYPAQDLNAQKKELGRLKKAKVRSTANQ